MTPASPPGSRAKPPRLTFGSIAIASVSLYALAPAQATDLSFKDFPYLIYCESAGIAHAFYFSRLGSDGVAIYITPGRQAGTITIDGVARRVGGEQSGSCSDKTLDDLRASGQAYDLAK